MPVKLSLDKSNFEVIRLPTDGCMIFATQDGTELARAACDQYADYDRNEMYARRHLISKLLTLMVERVNEEVAHDIRLHINPKLWLVKIEVD